MAEPKTQPQGPLEALERLFAAAVAIEREHRECCNCPGPRGCDNPRDHPSLSRLRDEIGNARGVIRRAKKEAPTHG